MSLPRRRSVSVWFADQPALLVVAVVLVLAAHFLFDLEHPRALLFDVALPVILMVRWFLKLFLAIEEH